MNPFLDRLNAHERHILLLLARGHTAKSVANLRGMSVNAVNEHLRSARRKTGAASSRELARALSDSAAQAAQESWDKFSDVAVGAPSLTSSRRRQVLRWSGARSVPWRRFLFAGSLTAAALLGYVSSEPVVQKASGASPGRYVDAVGSPDLMVQVVLWRAGDVADVAVVAGAYGEDVWIELAELGRVRVHAARPDAEGRSVIHARAALLKGEDWLIVRDMEMRADLARLPSFETSIEGTPYRFVIMPRRIMPPASGPLIEDRAAGTYPSQPRSGSTEPVVTG
jgi:DNA-binding CsgD family transcriptional regulator